MIESSSFSPTLDKGRRGHLPITKTFSLTNEKIVPGMKSGKAGNGMEEKLRCESFPFEKPDITNLSAKECLMKWQNTTKRMHKKIVQIKQKRVFFCSQVHNVRVVWWGRHVMYLILQEEKPTLQPTVSSKDLSVRGYSKTPATNFTLRIRSTASSILAIGIFPDSTRYVKSSMNSLYRKGTITCTYYRW